jgi:hypothetical protein
MPARRPHKRRCGGLARPCTEIAAVLCCCTYSLKALVENLNVTLTRHFTVGVTGFEPATSSSRTKRATKLRHTPYRTEPRRV